MPITLIPPQVPTIVGPGTSFFVQTDFIGPIPLDYEWIVQIFTEVSGPENPAAFWTAASDGSHEAVIENYQGQFSNIQGTSIQQGQPCTMQIQLLNQAQVMIDESDRFPITWDGSGALARWIQHQRTSTSGGLTPEEHDAVIETNNLSLAVNAATTAAVNIGSSILQVPIGQILSFIRPDAWRLVDLGGGITCNHIGVDLSDDALWGVIVRITQYPDTTVFKTPDNGYTFNDLAVLTFIHAGDIVQRHGIHTLSHTVSPLPAVSLPWPNNFGWPVQPSDYHVTVDWATGVCGELLGLRLP